MTLGSMRYRALLCVAVIAVFLSGCAAPLHKALKPEEISKIQRTNVRAMIAQEEIAMHVVQSTVAQDIQSAGGGLACVFIGSLIDKSEDKASSKRAEAWVAPLLEQTTDIDFRKDYWDALLPTLRSLTWMKIGETELTGAGKEMEEKWLKDNVFMAIANYELSPDGRFLVVGSRVQFWVKPKSKPSYYGWLTYVSKPIAPSFDAASSVQSDKRKRSEREKEIRIKREATIADAVGAWAENGGEKYRLALAEGIRETIRMLQFDLPDDKIGTTHLAGTPAEVKIPAVLESGSMIKHKGQILDRGDDRIIFRLQNGNLISFPLADLEILK